MTVIFNRLAGVLTDDGLSPSLSLLICLVTSLNDHRAQRPLIHLPTILNHGIVTSSSEHDL